MFEKVCQIAEQAATNVSRRGFLVRFGKGALMAAGALGAILASPGGAAAGRGCPKGTHLARCPGGSTLCCPSGTKCISGRGICGKPGKGHRA